MGAASRRQKLDPNYGQVISLPTPSLKYKHLDKISQEFLKQFDQELDELLEAETVPENYQTIKEKVRLWLHNRLLVYSQADRAALAKLLFSIIVKIQEDNSFNPLLISCIFKAVKEYLNPRDLQGLLDSLYEDIKTESQSDITDPCEKFAYEEMVQEIKLSHAVE